MKLMSSSSVTHVMFIEYVFELFYFNHCNLFSRVLIHPSNVCTVITCTSTCTMEADHLSLLWSQLSFQVSGTLIT